MSDNFHPITPELCKALRYRREKAGLSIARLSQITGTPSRLLSAYEAGTVRVRKSRLRQIAEALGATETALLLRVID